VTATYEEKDWYKKKDLCTEVENINGVKEYEAYKNLLLRLCKNYRFPSYEFDHTGEMAEKVRNNT
jgi:hypothetical protein